MSNRWHLKLARPDEPEVAKATGNLLVAGILGESFKYLEKPGVIRAISMPQKAWRKDRQTWWRQDIRNGLRMLVGLQGTTAVDTMLIWSCLDELYDPARCLRIMTAAEALIECSVAWNWISYICRQPVRVQKKGGLAAGVHEWAAKQRSLRLPPCP